MTRSERSFLLKAANALGACQLVEFELKHYIAQAFELCHKRLAGYPPFAMSGDDYEDAPMERLITIFRKLSNNPQLVQRIAAFKSERNFLAHRAIAACTDPDGGFQRERAQMLLGRLEKMQKEAFALVEAVREESGKWLAHLYFDPIDDKG